VRSVGGARPIACWAARAAAAMRAIGGANVERLASAQRVKVGHRVASLLIRHAQTRRRTAPTDMPMSDHSANASAIAACP
jgi:hypothetical protein